MKSDWASLLHGNKDSEVGVAPRSVAAAAVTSEEQVKRGRGRPRKKNPKPKFQTKPSFERSRPPKRIITAASDDESFDESLIRNQPKKSRRNFAKDDEARTRLQAAIDAVLGIGSYQGCAKMSVAKAASIFGVPRTTVRDRLKAMEGSKSKIVADHKKSQALPKIVEKKVVEVIKQLGERGFPIYAMHVKEFALELFQALPSSEKPKKGFTASNGWWEKFKERHEIQVSRRRVQAPQVTHADDQTSNTISRWYELLGRIIDSLRKLSPEFGPGCIWNLDESGFSHLGTMSYGGLLHKGARTVHRHTQTEQQLVTALTCIGDDGDWVHPLFVLIGDKLPTPRIETLKNQTSANCHFVTSSNGCTSIFREWCKQFVAHIDRKRGARDTWQLLIMDGHGKHSMEPGTMQYLLENRICALCLPAHTSWAPCEVSFFKSVETAYKRAVENCNIMNPLKTITNQQVPLFAFRALQVAATPENITYGFRNCGISPYDPDIVNNGCGELGTAPIASTTAFREPNGEPLSFKAFSVESEKKNSCAATTTVELCDTPLPISPVSLVERNESIVLAYVPQHSINLRASGMACLVQHDAHFNDSCIVAAIEAQVFDTNDVFVVDSVLFKNIAAWYENTDGIEQLSISDVMKILQNEHKGIWKFLSRARDCDGTLLFPIHLPGHWAFAAVLFRHKTIVWCDSYNPGKPDIVSSAKFTPLGLIQFILGDRFDEVAPIESRLQPNGYDCGAYVVRFAQIVASNRHSDVGVILAALQHHSSYFPVEGTGEFRKQLILKICRCFPSRNDRAAFGTEADLARQLADHERRITAMELKSKEHSDAKTSNTIINNNNNCNNTYNTYNTYNNYTIQIGDSFQHCPDGLKRKIGEILNGFIPKKLSEEDLVQQNKAAIENELR